MTKWEQIKAVIEYEDTSKEAVEKDILVKSTACFIMGIFPIVLTIFNINKGYIFMAVTTAILSALFLFAGVMCRVFKNRKITSIIIVIAVGIMFTDYAVSGANEGFAILWITCIPLLGQLLLGIREGVMLSLYFQILLMVMFYTPLREGFSHHYSEIFMIRYPILYMSILVVATWMYYQKLAGHKLSEEAGRIDAITGVDNRLGFNNKMGALLSGEPVPKLWFHVFDINRLKYVNDEYGHSAGDELIIAAAWIIKKNFPDALLFVRVGGDEFYMVHLEEKEPFEEKRKAFYEEVAAWKGKKAPFLAISCGYAMGEGVTKETVDHVFSRADKDMYEQKSEYYRRTGIERRRR